MHLWSLLLLRPKRSLIASGEVCPAEAWFDDYCDKPLTFLFPTRVCRAVSVGEASYLWKSGQYKFMLILLIFTFGRNGK
jgi:hypothetical protein